jgi:hypothetical protein
MWKLPDAQASIGTCRAWMAERPAQSYVHFDGKDLTLQELFVSLIEVLAEY